MIPYDLVQTFVWTLQAAWNDARAPNVTVTSWYRDPAHNRRVGGAARSQHLLALALDVLPNPPGQRFASSAARHGLTVVNEGDHLHIQAYPAGRLPDSLFT